MQAPQETPSDMQAYEVGSETLETSIRSHYGRIYQLTCSYTHDAEEAQDLTQEVFLRAHQAFPMFRGRSSVYTWLHRIATNTCIDHVRKARTRSRAEQVGVGHQVESREMLGVDRRTPLHDTLDDEIGAEIRRAVRLLPPRQREVFVLRYRRGLALREIADAVDRRIGTVKRQLFDATHKVRALLEPYLDGSVPRVAHDDHLDWRGVAPGPLPPRRASHP